LNRWPADYESAALPTELRRHTRSPCFGVPGDGPLRITSEPTTKRSEDRTDETARRRPASISETRCRCHSIRLFVHGIVFRTGRVHVRGAILRSSISSRPGASYPSSWRHGWQRGTKQPTQSSKERRKARRYDV